MLFRSGALAVGAETRVLVETVIREDAIELYAFATAEERDWFRLLTTVQGVGAKVALSRTAKVSVTMAVTSAVFRPQTGRLTKASEAARLCPGGTSGKLCSSR